MHILTVACNWLDVPRKRPKILCAPASSDSTWSNGQATQSAHQYQATASKNHGYATGKPPPCRACKEKPLSNQSKKEISRLWCSAGKTPPAENYHTQSSTTAASQPNEYSSNSRYKPHIPQETLQQWFSIYITSQTLSSAVRGSLNYYIANQA